MTASPPVRVLDPDPVLLGKVKPPPRFTIGRVYRDIARGLDPRLGPPAPPSCQDPPPSPSHVPTVPPHHLFRLEIPSRSFWNFSSSLEVKQKCPPSPSETQGPAPTLTPCAALRMAASGATACRRSAARRATPRTAPPPKAPGSRHLLHTTFPPGEQHSRYPAISGAWQSVHAWTSRRQPPILPA